MSKSVHPSGGDGTFFSLASFPRMRESSGERLRAMLVRYPLDALNCARQRLICRIDMRRWIPACAGMTPRLWCKGSGGVFLPMAALGLLLSGCTMFRPPAQMQGMPDRNSIVAGQEIIVGKNQNVYGLARKHGVSMREMIVLNDLKPPFTLKTGQHLVLPAKNQDNAPVPSAAPLGGIEATPLEPMSSPNAGSQEVAAVELASPVVSKPSMPSLPSSPAPAQAQLAQTPAPSLLAPPVEPKPVVTTVAAVRPKMPEPLRQEESSSKSDISFVWPLQGQILSDFGKKAVGTNNDGINIGAPKGAPVVAAAGGMVVYAGNEMKGFGNLVLIKHEGGWVTAYAHLDRMLVNKDTVVAPGDMIGTVGNSGGVSAPQLHFETRFDGKAVDPQTVIKKS